MKDLIYQILNKSIICVEQKNVLKYFRICEIELYLYNNNHKDSYVQRSLEQGMQEKWYFHKHNSEYDEGRKKGIEITLGDKSNNQYFGILIRSIHEITFDGNNWILIGDIIEGPNKTVDILLDYVKIKDYLLDVSPRPMSIHDNVKKLTLVASPNIMPVNIYCGRRITYNCESDSRKFDEAKYRLIIYKDKIKEKKSGLVLYTGQALI